MNRRAGHQDGPVARDDAWRGGAACAGMDTELFYAEGTVPSEVSAACGRCPVAARCLATALDEREPHGVWGGVTAARRRMLRRTHPGLSGHEIAAITQSAPGGATVRPAGDIVVSTASVA